MRVLLSLSESTPCSHCHISNLCDFHISIALLIGARSHISHSYTEHAQFLAIFRELLNTSHFWKRRMLSAHRWFHLRVEQRQNHSRLPSSRLRCRSCFALYFESLGSKFHMQRKCEQLTHSGSSPNPSYDRDPSTNILLLCMLFRTSSSVTAVIARHSEPQ